MILSKAMVVPEAPFVRAVDIARKIGVEHWTNENWLVSDILYKLRAEERVEQKTNRGPWKLTEALLNTQGRLPPFHLPTYTIVYFKERNPANPQ